MTWYRINQDGSTEPTADAAESMRSKDEFGHVALDQFRCELCGFVGRVSTVFLGLDHQWGNGLPLIFETMVFEGDGFSEVAGDRYSTIEQAREGHRKLLDAVRRGEQHACKGTA